ncbi:Rieske (2Fe-2S) protein [Mycolicibacterium sp.]|uniref:Rieske (2Fe-2S) protein n=1 Tax=Mycolicibacterium sp. TaxID=2320850 RepID=UPI003D0C7120
MTADWIAVGTLAELTRRRKLRVEVDGRAIALFHAGGQVYAFDDVCVHQDRSLAKGTLLHGKVICPGHQWQFDLETGYEEQQDRCQPTYRVRVEDDTVYVSAAPRVAVPAAVGEESL